MTDGSLFATFQVAELRFGVDVERVQEVLRFQEMTRVPLAPAVIGGLINLRGQIVTAVDLRLRLGLGRHPKGDRPMNVILRTATGSVSLLVDRIGDVVAVDPDTFEAPPTTVSPETRKLVRGVFKLGDGLLHVLDTAAALDIPAAEPAPWNGRNLRGLAA